VHIVLKDDVASAAGTRWIMDNKCVANISSASQLSAFRPNGQIYDMALYSTLYTLIIKTWGKQKNKSGEWT